MANSGMTLEGGTELLKVFQDVRKSKANSINRSAINKATTPVLKAARANAPKDKGDLAKAQVKKMINRGGTATGMVGVDSSYVGEDGSKPINYDHLEEYGHLTKDGKQVPANPYMRKTGEDTKAIAQQIYEDAFAAGIEKAMTV